MATASFAYIAHPFGAFAGWILSDTIGRRKSLLLACIPFVIGWTMLYFSNSLALIYSAFAVMGLGFGLKEASSMTYTSEIWYFFSSNSSLLLWYFQVLFWSETSIRGVMLGTAGTFASIGYFSVFLFGAFASWRTVSIFCIIIPVCMFSAMLFVRIFHDWYRLS